MQTNPYFGHPGHGHGRQDAIVKVLLLIADLLRQIVAAMGNPVHRHGLLRPEEVERMLGVTDRTLRRYAKDGVLCPIRIGSMRYYRMRDILRGGGTDG